jgi:hypothetical protein
VQTSPYDIIGSLEGADPDIAAGIQDLVRSIGAHSLKSRQYNLRSLLGRCLDHPVERFLSHFLLPNAPAFTLYPLSSWPCASDLRIDRRFKMLWPWLARGNQPSAQLLATVNSLIGLGMYLSLFSARRLRRFDPEVGGTVRTEMRAIAPYEYCERCPSYTERYLEVLAQKRWDSYQVILHEPLEHQFSRRGSRRFCAACKRQSAEYRRREAGAESFMGWLGYKMSDCSVHGIRPGPRELIELCQKAGIGTSEISRRRIAFFLSDSRRGQKEAPILCEDLERVASRQHDFIERLLVRALPNFHLPAAMSPQSSSCAQFELALYRDSANDNFLTYDTDGGGDNIEADGFSYEAAQSLVPYVRSRFELGPLHIIKFEIPELKIEVNLESDPRQSRLRLLVFWERAYQYRWVEPFLRTGVLPPREAQPSRS